MACRGSAVRIRLAPLDESLPLEGFSSFWDYLRSLWKSVFSAIFNANLLCLLQVGLSVHVSG